MNIRECLEYLAFLLLILFGGISFWGIAEYQFRRWIEFGEFCNDPDCVCKN